MGTRWRDGKRFHREDRFAAAPGRHNGPEQDVIRPAVIPPNDTGNRSLRTAIVAPAAGKIHMERTRPAHAAPDEPDGASLSCMEQARVIDEHRDLCHAGKLPAGRVGWIDAILRVSVGPEEDISSGAAGTDGEG